MSKITERKYLDLGFIIYFLVVPIIFLETYYLELLNSINWIYLPITIVWAISSLILFIRILIIEFKTKRYGWFVSTLIFLPIGWLAMPIFYFAGYRKYLLGKEKLEDILF